MKRSLVLFGAMVALSATPVLAAVPGVDIGWTSNATNGCPAQLTSIADIGDPCDNNLAGPYSFALSLCAPTGITKWIGEEIAIDFQSAVMPLADWWHLESADPFQGFPAGCREGSFSFTTKRGLGNTATCKDYWGVDPQPGRTIWYLFNPRPNHNQVWGSFARDPATASAIVAGTNYYVGSGLLDMNHAVPEAGVQSCSGCLYGCCIVFESVKILQPPGTPNGDVLVTGHHNRSFMTWQGGVGTDCPFAAPVRTKTWGQVKSLYR